MDSGHSGFVKIFTLTHIQADDLQLKAVLFDCKIILINEL